MIRASINKVVILITVILLISSKTSYGYTSYGSTSWVVNTNYQVI